MSRLPLNGASDLIRRASSVNNSLTVPPASSTWALVVVKWKFIGTTPPCRMNACEMMCSAARPWWAGRKYFLLNTSSITSFSRANDSEPA